MEIRNYAASNYGVSETKKTSKDLNVNDFLKIMAAEISNQSPFGGGEGGGSKSDYLTQMAQFTTLEQLNTIAESINVLALMNQQQYTFSLIGKEVSVVDGDSEITGVVEKVKFQNGYGVVVVGGKDYTLGAITSIAEPEVIEDEL